MKKLCSLLIASTLLITSSISVFASNSLQAEVASVTNFSVEDRENEPLISNVQLYNRDASRRKALRKRRLAEQVYPDGKEPPYYDNLHQYSKNKIHCSCPLCSAKTKNKGKRRRKASGWEPSINYKPSDLRRQEAMDLDEAIFETENGNE